MNQNQNTKNHKKFPAETAGRRMVENVPVVSPERTILDVKNMLFEKMEDLETINYIYVVNKAGKLVGVFSIKEIFRKPEETTVKEIMEEEIVKVRPYTDQERVAILALKHNLKSIPVVDKEERFLGVVPSDIILDILHSENVEDILRFAGIHKSHYLFKAIKAPVSILVKARLPWLILGLGGGILAAGVVSFFESSLKDFFILAAFIPLMVYMAGAVGIQTQTLFIRSLTVDIQLNIKKYFFREVKIGFIIALVSGVLLSLVSSLWIGNYYIGIILGFSMFLTIISAIFIGIFIPWLLYKFKKDPAIGAGPFGTIVQDIISVAVYLSIASLMLRFF